MVLEAQAAVVGDFMDWDYLLYETRQNLLCLASILFLCYSVYLEYQKSGFPDCGRYRRGEKYLGLVLNGRDTFQWSIDMMREFYTAKKVRMRNYSLHTTLNFVDHQALVEVFRAAGRLPCLEVLHIDFQCPLPVQALAALFEELELQKIPKPWYKKKWWWFRTFQPAKLTRLQLQIWGWADGATRQDLRHLKGQLEQNNSLVNVSVRVASDGTKHQHLTASIVSGLCHHPHLDVLTLSVCLEESSSILRELIALVQTNSSLTTLTIHGLLCRRDKTCEGISQLAQALSRRTIHETSHLTTLVLDFPFPVLPFSNKLASMEGRFVQCMVALEQMCQSNYNLVRVQVGEERDGNRLFWRNWVQEEDDEEEAEEEDEEEQPNKSRFHLQLNQRGRKELLWDTNTTRMDWIDAIVRDCDNVSVTFYWLSRNPTLLPATW